MPMIQLLFQDGGAGSIRMISRYRIMGAGRADQVWELLNPAQDAAAEQDHAGGDQADIVQAGVVIVPEAPDRRRQQQGPHQGDAAEQERHA